MASLLQIHYADIRVVSVWPIDRRQLSRDLEETGTLAVEFEVFQGTLKTEDDIENEDPGFFDRVTSAFESTMSTVVEFMGTPVLNA